MRLISCNEFSRYKGWILQPLQLIRGRPNIQIELVESCWQLKSLESLSVPLFLSVRTEGSDMASRLNPSEVQAQFLLSLPALFWVFFICSVVWNLDRHRMKVSLQRMTSWMLYTFHCGKRPFRWKIECKISQ